MSSTVLDGNGAAISAAYRLSEVCCIFPITPASPMAEAADAWASEHRPNIWGSVPTVVEMQSEAGAAGALHGALQGGALGTTFTASQGLLLMIPNMYKIAGELTPAVIHVAARSLAVQALSIFGDHSDVMAARQTGFAMLASSSVQEAHDLAAVAHAATLAARVPFVHFFDGFRTSHELNTISLLTDDDLAALVPVALVRAHRRRALSPELPFIRGTSQNPDVYFQGRETVNPFYERAPAIIQDAMDRLASRCGRHYRIVDYTGHPEAERVVVFMGSGAETARETVTYLASRGERVGALTVRLFRPFPAAELIAALPATVRRIAVLDRTKEAGSFGEPLFLDTSAAVAEASRAGLRPPVEEVSGGRYGLASKELSPGMVAGVLAALDGRNEPSGGVRPRFTLGITDDVSGSSLPYDASLVVDTSTTMRALFFGLGSDGTVGATKNTVKILGSQDGLYAQGYFSYDSRKAGSPTVSHLRVAPEPIRAPYLVGDADFVGCHHPSLLDRLDVLANAAHGATLLLNTPQSPATVWGALSRPIQDQILLKGLQVHVVDANRIARELGLGERINTVLQACFFSITGVIDRELAINQIKESAASTYGRRGAEVVVANVAAVDRALAEVSPVVVPGHATSTTPARPVVASDAPPFVRNVTAVLMAGRGDQLPVSAIPVDGTWPSGTAAFEKPNVSDLVATWDPDLCIQCGNCSFVCPHAVIRARFFDRAVLEGAPATFPSAPLVGKGLPDTAYAFHVYVEDCTGCGLCVEACPVTTDVAATDDPAGRAPRRAGGGDTGPARKAINLTERAPIVESSRRNQAFFATLAPADRTRVDFGTVRGAQFLEPLFEFPGACAGCGETPYLKLLSQLFGDRAVIANATGCSSIYGGNLPTTPWTIDTAGRGPAWSNSLFEDNAEFGLGLRLAADGHAAIARERLQAVGPTVGEDLASAILDSHQIGDTEMRAQHRRVTELKRRLAAVDHPDAADLASVADHLIRRSVWIVGGDGWAYDIGSGGLDHVLASGRDVNILVLDTEVYSNTGGQASKATPLGAVAKFAAAGKTSEKKDLALQAIAYGSVYVARVAMGADPQQTLRAMREAEAFAGPALVIAYSHCIAHGIDMRDGLDEQYRAVASGDWPLMRYDPVLRTTGGNPFLLDSPRPRLALDAYRRHELRYTELAASDPTEAARLAQLAQAAVDERWRTYEEMATRPAHRFPADARHSRARP